MKEQTNEAPTLVEAAAVFAAVDTYGRKLHPRKKRLASDLPRLLDELVASVARVRSVTHE